ncbi:MAG: hypothetical protein ACP5I1_17110, partial [Candidatus Hinthialibacter sp.]
VYAGTEKGVYVLQGPNWKMIEGSPQAPVYVMKGQQEGAIAAIGEYLYEIDSERCQNISFLPSSETNDISIRRETFLIATNYGLYRVKNGRVKPVRRLNDLLGENPTLYAVACSEDGMLAAAAEAGLFVKKPGESWSAVHPRDENHGGWAPQPVFGVAFDAQKRLWFASRQGVGCYDEEWKLYTGSDGLPYNDFTCLSAGEDGAVWFGTQIGAIRFDGENWGYRQGRRWLPHDQINDLAVMQNGSAWIATPGGVGLIERRPMTLQEKAAFYEEEIEKYIKRTEYGYLSEVILPTPGDKSEIRYSDSDNDGLWTSMYGAGECFAYGAT